MKKLVAFFLFVTTLFAFLTLSCYGAYSIESGKDTLNSQFQYGKGPNTDGYSIDYRFFSPVKEKDSQKYPLVVWIHGHANGQYDGYQLIPNSISNWSSAEFQERFYPSGGAFIMAVRAPEDKGISWNEELKRPLKSAIDDFIQKNTDSVDTSRIYIGGYSLGGMMTFEMCTEYPEMFAAMFPICPYITPQELEADVFSHIPVWLTSGKTDHLVSYSGKVLKIWDKITNTTNHTESCRLSSLERVCYPDGKSTPTGHYSWEAVTNDMFSNERADYPYMSTVNGKGETVILTYPHGMISWLCQFTSDYKAQQIDTSDTGEDTPRLSIFDYIGMFFTKIYIFFRNLIRPITG